jgi:hypothetical protein
MVRRPRARQRSGAPRPPPEPVASLRLPQNLKPALRLPQNLKPAPLGSLTTDFSSATFATVPSLAAVTSRPTQSLITAKTGTQIGPGSRVLGPGSRFAVRVLRY